MLRFPKERNLILHKKQVFVYTDVESCKRKLVRKGRGTKDVIRRTKG